LSPNTLIDDLSTAIGDLLKKPQVHYTFPAAHSGAVVFCG